MDRSFCSSIGIFIALETNMRGNPCKFKGNFVTDVADKSTKFIYQSKVAARLSRATRNTQCRSIIRKDNNAL